MKFIPLDPPGTFCHVEAVFDMIKRCGGESFVEVGCGAGDLSKKLCDRGLRGTGVDFSASAIEAAERRLVDHIRKSQYRLIQGDIADIGNGAIEKADLGLSMMVMEHVHDDVQFIRNISRFIHPGGHVILAVPGRRDRWCFEDETVGHLRRYDRDDLEDVLLKAGLTQVEVWSVSVPVANLLFRLGNYMVRNSAEPKKLGQSQRQQTETSGLREIRFKTMFPPWFKLILNRTTLYPLFILQRLFYRTGLGVEMIASGRVPE